MKLSFGTLLAGLASLRPVVAIELDVSSPTSIRSAVDALAHGVMVYYHNNHTDTDPTAVGTFPPPSYWWEGGAIWGGMIDNWAYTNDQTYVPVITQALLAQVGPDNNYMPPAYFSSLGNDDQAFWAFAVLTAVEYGFPTPEGSSSTVWLDLAEAVFNTQIARWDTSTCNGGLKWQIFKTNPGYNYKNSVSNGGLFQIAARLARHTGNQTYVDWAEKVWDWMEGVGLIDDQYNVFDGTDDATGCTETDHTIWSYNPSMLLYGTAILYNYTNGADMWQKRTTGLVKAISNTFFSPYPNATNIAFERACEQAEICNYDQLSFKAYLARWLSKSSIVAPYIIAPVRTFLTRSAQAAAEACSGGDNEQTCGSKWYIGGYDGTYGVGQQLSALETVQSLLLLAPDVNVSPPVEPQTTSSVHTTKQESSATSSRMPTDMPTDMPTEVPTDMSSTSEPSPPGTSTSHVMGLAPTGTTLSVMPTGMSSTPEPSPLTGLTGTASTETASTGHSVGLEPSGTMSLMPEVVSSTPKPSPSHNTAPNIGRGVSDLTGLAMMVGTLVLGGAVGGNLAL